MAKKTMAPAAAKDPYADPEDGSEKDYKANRAYETLIEAAGHEANMGMMERVKKIAGRKHKAVAGLHDRILKGGEPPKEPLRSIADIRKIAGEKVKQNKRHLG